MPTDRHVPAVTGCAGLHEILGIEVGTTGVGRTGGVHDGELTLLPQRLKRRERRVQAEESVEIENVMARNIDRGTHGVIRSLAVGDNDVEAVGCAALKYDDQPLVLILRVGGISGTSEKAWDGRGADNGHGTIAKKYATGDGHGKNAFSY